MVNNDAVISVAIMQRLISLNHRSRWGSIWVLQLTINGSKLSLNLNVTAQKNSNLLVNIAHQNITLSSISSGPRCSNPIAINFAFHPFEVDKIKY